MSAWKIQNPYILRDRIEIPRSLHLRRMVYEQGEYVSTEDQQ
jgi:hypothetical protein